MNHVTFSSVALGVTLALGSTATTQAQDAPAAQQRTLDEVVVTAQRRQETVQEIPLAVSAFDSAQLSRLGVTEALDMTRLVPNFYGSNNTGLGTANVYSIRGLNNTESIATFDPPVGSYIDDIYVSRQNGNNFTLFDVDRIEVLRGPQGTLFGRNTTGGAVNVIMRRPAEEFGGFVEMGFGRFNRKLVRGTVDLPVNDTLLTKVSGYWIEDEGYLNNRTTGETLNFEENYGLRADIRWMPTDTLTWDVSADYVDTQDAAIQGSPDGRGGFVTDTGLRRDGNLAGVTMFGILTDGTFGPVGPLASTKSFIPTGNLVRAWSLTSRLSFATALGDLEVITGYREMNQKFFLDFFNGPTPWGGFAIINDGQHDQFTQEVKLAGSAWNDNIDYVVGAYFMDEDNVTDFADIFNIGVPFLLADRTMDNNTRAWAIYGQADWRFAADWTATLGVRYTDEKKDIGYTPNNALLASSLTTQAIIDQGVPVETKTQLWTPRVALQYEINDDMNAYVSATRGFKSGGWNARNNNALLVQPFDPEVVWSYEAGFRSELMNRRLRFNATAFMTDVTDFQLPSAFTGPTGIVFITQNFADLEIKGVEFELLALATERLTLFANLGIQDSEYKNIDPSIIQQQQNCLAGVAGACGTGIVTPQGGIATPVRTPEYSLAVGADYAIQVGPQLELVPSFTVTRFGKHEVGTSNAAFSAVDAYSNINAAISLEDMNGAWSLRLDCKNCNNRVQLNSVLPPLPYYNKPRTWMASFRYNF